MWFPSILHAACFQIIGQSTEACLSQLSETIVSLILETAAGSSFAAGSTSGQHPLRLESKIAIEIEV